MQKAVIGKLKEEKGNLEIDIDRLMETRLLVESNSGGGKSYLLRKILETTHGHVQHVVLDIEGDFASLREKFDYVLAGKGGDIPADPRSAELLAKKILDLKASLIVDLYELKHHDRIRFVRLFLEEMINAPKDLWHPVLLILDEAHIFVPEKGQSEAASAVIDLATRGRKRGYCIALATQRLSKLHKDAAAECLNKLVGRTGLDIDMKRAADELGMTGRQDMLQLRDLDPGEFFAFGPAISKQVVRAKVGEVLTKHPRAGKRAHGVVPAAPARVKSILAKLADLPKEAEAEVRDLQSLKERVKVLERELREAKAAKPEAVVDEKQIEQAKRVAVSDSKKELEKRLKDFIDQIQDKAKELTKDFSVSFSPMPQKIRASVPLPRVVPQPRIHVGDEGNGQGFGRCEREILKFLAMREGRWFTKVQVGTMTGYSHGSGGFNNSLCKLSQSGLIVRQGNQMSLHSEAAETVKKILGPEYLEPSNTSLEAWLSKLPKCERAIYQLLLENPEPFTKEALGEATGYSASSGGFNNALSRLSTLGLVVRQGGMILLNPEVLSV